MDSIRFGRLCVDRAQYYAAKSREKVLCTCDCGKQKHIRKDGVGNTVFSCGCLQRERALASTRKHSMCGTPEYRSWQSAKDRCLNPKNPAYKNYGGRGIFFCERWQKFELFYKDMGDRPNGTTLDRIDNEKGYEPNNCRWATWFDQAKNKRPRELGASKTQGVWHEPSRGGRWAATKWKNGVIAFRRFYKTEEEAVSAIKQFIGEEKCHAI